MAWAYSNWMNATQSYAITAVDQARRTLSVAGDKRPFFTVTDSVNVDTGGNAGAYMVSGVVYTAGATQVVVDRDLASGMVAGALVAGPNAAVSLVVINQHYQEVVDLITGSVGTDMTTYNAQVLGEYLKNIVLPERNKLLRRVGGVLVRGRIVFRYNQMT